MLQKIINSHIQQPTWLSSEPVQGQIQEGVMFPWLNDNRLSFYLNSGYRLTHATLVREDNSFGHYCIQGVDLNNDNRIDFLVILDQSRIIIENFIFSLKNDELYDEIIITRIKNREQKIFDDLLSHLGLSKNRQDVELLKELLMLWEINIYTKPITHSEIKFFKFLLNFGLNSFRTNGNIDFRKINFTIQRLNNPWTAPEIRVILHLLGNYIKIQTIKEAEMIYQKIGGIKNTALIMHKGKYNEHLINIVQKYNLQQKQLLNALIETKKMIARLNW